jgi:hypothetical protein
MEKKDFTLKYYNVSVHTDRLIVTPQYEFHGSSHRNINNVNSDDEILKNPIKKKIKFNTDGHMSSLSIRKMKRAISYLTLISANKTKKSVFNYTDIKFKLVFVTLTLSSVQVHSDIIIKNKLINQFIIEAKNKFKVKNYVWRMERQKNGRVHFHFIFDRFIQYQELRDTWNRIQNKLGYVDRYSEKMSKLSFDEYYESHVNKNKYTVKEAKELYKKNKAQAWLFPNSTDVHSLRFISNITDYLTVYLTKKEQNKDLEGRLYGTSQNLSDLKGGRDIISSNISDELSKIYKEGKFKSVKGDYYDIIFIDYFDLQKLGCTQLYQLFIEFCLQQFDFTPQSSFL